MVASDLRVPTLLKRTVINYAVVICLAMATQFLLNLLTFIGLFGFYYCHRPLCMRYRCIELRRLYSFGGFALSLALTVDGRQRIAVGLGKNKRVYEGDGIGSDTDLDVDSS